jgi:hypothetical protein
MGRLEGVEVPCCVVDILCVCDVLSQNTMLVAESMEGLTCLCCNNVFSENVCL